MRYITIIARHNALSRGMVQQDNRTGDTRPKAFWRERGKAPDAKGKTGSAGRPKSRRRTLPALGGEDGWRRRQARSSEPTHWASDGVE